MRPMPADFATVSQGMTVKALQRHYRAKYDTIRRWRDVAGADSGRYDKPPADFAHYAAIEHKCALGRRYRCSVSKIDRWLSIAGVTPPCAKRGPAPNRRPVPDDFAQVAPTMLKTHLRIHYGVNQDGLDRWIGESGVFPKTFEGGAGNVRPTRVPGQSNLARLRNYSIHDQAADILRRDKWIVYRCDERGVQAEKGKFWRVGNVVVDGDELLARAEKKKARAA